jgi:mutator protein MutT
MNPGAMPSQPPADHSIDSPIEVAAGLVFRDGKLLITRRSAGGHLAGLWEFPGGKREPGETFEQCLHRELREELGIEVQIVALIEDLVHHYPERSIRLKFFRCRWLRCEPRPILCESLAWITCAQLSDYAFPAADTRLLNYLRQAPEPEFHLKSNHYSLVKASRA